jgi:hypothetical protein
MDRAKAGREDPPRESADRVLGSQNHVRPSGRTPQESKTAIVQFLEESGVIVVMIVVHDLALTGRLNGFLFGYGGLGFKGSGLDDTLNLWRITHSFCWRRVTYLLGWSLEIAGWKRAMFPPRSLRSQWFNVSQGDTP